MLETLAPAKINLYLHVLARREDGYHQIDSLVAFVDVGDTLTLAPASSFSLTVTGSFADQLNCQLKTNLVWRAVVGLAERHQLLPKLTLTLTKELPVAAGLGGGSADAGACLRLLKQWWNIEDDQGIHAISAGLGADVPACLSSQPAYLGGCGELVTPVSLPPFGIVLVNPGVALSTAEVFAGVGRTFSPPGRIRRPLDDVWALADALGTRCNDLCAVASARLPVISQCLSQLRLTSQCLLARMSGSGASCFGLYPSFELASQAASRLQADQPQWWIRAGVGIGGQMVVRQVGAR